MAERQLLRPQHHRWQTLDRTRECPSRFPHFLRHLLLSVDIV